MKGENPELENILNYIIQPSQIKNSNNIAVRPTHNKKRQQITPKNSYKVALWWMEPKEGS